MSLRAVADNSSFYFFTPNKMKSIFDFMYIDHSLTSSYDDYTYSMNDHNLNFSYNLGISESLSFGISNGYSETTYNIKNSSLGLNEKYKDIGMTDWILQGKWRQDWWIMGIEIGYSPTENKTSGLDSNNTNKNGNRFSGGNRLKNTFGVIFNHSNFNFGLETSYDYHFESISKSSNDNSTKTTDNHILNISPFIEWNFNNGFLSAKITRLEQMKANNKVTTSSGYNYDFASKGYVSQLFNLSSSYNINPNLSILFSYEQMYVPKISDDSKSYVIFTDSIGMRVIY